MLCNGDMSAPYRCLFALVGLLLSPVVDAQPQDAATVKRKRLKDKAADFWIYDDIDKGYALAADSKKPLLVSFRCVP